MVHGDHFLHKLSYMFRKTLGMGIIAISVFFLHVQANSTHTFSVTRSVTEEAHAEEENEWDPCGLTSVICEGERTGVEAVIADTFPEEPDTMIAIAKAESGLNVKAMGWNCRYTRKDGTMYSTACVPGDRGKAWSVDCGLMQINTPGKVCPSELFDVEHNLSIARKKYERQGKDAWVAHWTNSYKKYL